MTEFVPRMCDAGLLLLPREIAETVPPRVDGRWRGAALLALSPEHIARLDDTDVIDGLEAVRHHRARLEAQETRLLARLDELRKGSRYVGDEAALELRISRHAAADRVVLSSAMVARMPRLLELMDDGELDGYAARKLVEICKPLSDENAREVDARLAEKLNRGTINVTDPVSVRRATRRLAARVDPDSVATRARQARCERKVQLIPGEDAMSRLIADLPAEVASRAYANVDAHAKRLRNSGDERNLDQLRADVLGALLEGAPAETGKPSGAAMVFLHMPVDAALTMSDDGCELAGYGPIPGPVAREIMSNPGSVLRKVLVDPTTGRIEGLGRRRRRANQALRDLIAVRDRECAFCHRPAQNCDADHEREWARDHGGTDPTNLGPKCEHEHYMKDDPGWDLRTDPETGEATITTPANRTYRRQRETIIELNPQPPKPEPPPKPPLPDEPPF